MFKMSYLKKLHQPTLLIFWCLFSFPFILCAAPGPETGDKQEEKVTVKVISIIDRDERGHYLRYPADLAYDPDMEELYAVVGGKGRIIVFGANFFPTVSLGEGRGATAPRGVFLDAKGMVYVSQGVMAGQKPRLTVFNPAFFPVNAISFDKIPEGENFSPRNLTIGLTGKVYVTGLNTRGLLVLDKDLRFDHWLTPVDTVFEPESSNDQTLEEALADQLGGPAPPEEPDLSPASDFEEEQGVDMRELLPAELLPSTDENGPEQAQEKTGPVRVTDVVRDSEGHLYVLSEETSKIYVYSPNEELLFSFGQKGGSTGKMSRPRSLAIDEKKKAVYVVDYMRHTVLIYNLGGRYMYEFGGMGTDPGWFQYPTSITLLNDGYLAVADLFNHRIQILDVDFEYKFSLFGKKKDQAREEETVPQGQEHETGDVLQPSPL